MYVFVALALGVPMGYFIARTVDPDFRSIIVRLAAGSKQLVPCFHL